MYDQVSAYQRITDQSCTDGKVYTTCHQRECNSDCHQRNVVRIIQNTYKCCIFSKSRTHCTKEDEHCDHDQENDKFLSSHSVNERLVCASRLCCLICHFYFLLLYLSCSHVHDIFLCSLGNIQLTSFLSFTHYDDSITHT